MFAETAVKMSSLSDIKIFFMNFLKKKYKHEKSRKT